MGRIYLKTIASWAEGQGVNVERVNTRRIDVFTDGSVVVECHNLQEVVDAVYEFQKKTTQTIVP